MALSIPSLGSLAATIRSAFKTEMPGVDAEIWPNNLYITGKVMAEALQAVYLRLRYVRDQTRPSLATGADLDRHAYEVGLARKGAAYASGSVTVVGLAGESVPAGRRFLRESDGRVYVTTAATTVPSSGSVLLPVRATETGYRYKAVAGATLVREASYPELTSEATIAPGGITGGAVAESDTELRLRVLDVLRNRPMGGAKSDYRQWAESVTGVRKAFVSRWDDDDSPRVAVAILAQGRGTDALPDDTLVAKVAELIEAERPVAAKVSVIKPTGKTVNIKISGLDPAATAVEDEIQRELSDLFYERAIVCLPDGNTTFPLNWINEAISTAYGENRHTLVSPTADVLLTQGQYPVLGTITYV